MGLLLTPQAQAHPAENVGRYEEAKEADRPRNNQPVEPVDQVHHRVVVQRRLKVAGPRIGEVLAGVGMAFPARFQQIGLDSRFRILWILDIMHAVAVITDGFIRLFVYRRPLDPIDGPASELEIKDHYHMGLLDWVNYRALTKQDAETFDDSRASAYRVSFADHIGRAIKEKSSREDRKRKVRFSW